MDFPAAAALVGWWRKLHAEPFRGISTDGHVEPGLYRVADEGAPIEETVRAAKVLLERLNERERAALLHAVDAVEWRLWSNPEFLFNPCGLRLEEISAGARNAILQVIRASLSSPGYAKTRGCMQTNAFLGQLCGLPKIMNEWSYNFLLFGLPSADEPWGWSIYGHHVALNCFLLGRQMVISPSFMGAEPNFVDAGVHSGLRLFDAEERGGIGLMRSLSPALRERATTYRLMKDPSMPEGRWNPADQRHLGGAFQDNRIIPYEGIPVTEFLPVQRERLMELIVAFITYLPDTPRAARLAHIESALERTWWSWIGGWGDEDPFYYRIHSPVVMIEFDHHSGVWLNNEEPAKCHIHTIVRTPNGNDYGKDLLRQHYASVHPTGSPGVE